MEEYNVKAAVLEALLYVKRHGPLRKDWALCSNVRQVAGTGLFCSADMQNEVSIVLQSLGAAWYKQRTGENLLVVNWGYFINGHTSWKTELRFGRFWSNPVRLDFLHWAIDYLVEELDYPV